MQFKEAIQSFVDKGVVTPDEFALLEGAAKARAFSVGGLTDKYALEVVKRSLETAIADGTPVNTWLTGIEDTFEESGLTSLEEGAAHMRLVYRANVFGAYNAGRWTQQRRGKVARPYLQRISAAHGLPEAEQVAANVRPEHADADGTIRPVDDEYWTYSYPPMLNGEYEYNCRCMVVSVSQAEMEAEGLDVTPDSDITVSPRGADAQDPAEEFFLGNDKVETGQAGENAYREFLED